MCLMSRHIYVVFSQMKFIILMLFMAQAFASVRISLDPDGSDLTLITVIRVSGEIYDVFDVLRVFYVILFRLHLR